ncbi:MAG: hypothetical protein LQ346_006976, partial [Caloplaca aetnensis]
MATDNAGNVGPRSSPEAQVFDEATTTPTVFPGASTNNAPPPSGAAPGAPVAPSNSSAPTPAPSTIPWDQTPEFLASSDWTVHPGAPTEYNPPRTVGNGGPTDVTSFHPAQATWSEDNLPDILYTYKPPTNWQKFYDNNAIRRLFPPPKTDANGNIMYERWPGDANKPDPLLDFPHLPDQIGTKEAWWVFETWRRWKDILMRQEYPHRSAAPTNIQALVSHNRPAFKIASWHPQQSRVLGVPSRGIEWLAEMSEEQQRRNTTRGLTPGLVDPSRGEEGGRVALPKRSRGAGVSKGRRGPARGGKKQDVGKEKQGGDDEASRLQPEAPPPTKRRRKSTIAPPRRLPRNAYTIPPTEATILSSRIPTQNPTPQSSTRFGLHPASEEGRYGNVYQSPLPSATSTGPPTYRYPPVSTEHTAPYGPPQHPDVYSRMGYHGLGQDPRQSVSWYPSPMPPPPPPPFAQPGGANVQQYQYPPPSTGPYTTPPYPNVCHNSVYQCPRRNPPQFAAPATPLPPPPCVQLLPQQGINRDPPTSNLPAPGTNHASPRQPPPPPPPFLSTDPGNTWMNQYIDFDPDVSPSNFPTVHHPAPQLHPTSQLHLDVPPTPSSNPPPPHPHLPHNRNPPSNATVTAAQRGNAFTPVTGAGRRFFAEREREQQQRQRQGRRGRRDSLAP